MGDLAREHLEEQLPDALELGFGVLRRILHRTPGRVSDPIAYRVLARGFLSDHCGMREGRVGMAPLARQEGHGRASSAARASTLLPPWVRGGEGVGTFVPTRSPAEGQILEGMKSTGDPLVDALFKVRKGKVEFVDVPELAFLVIDGGGDPAGEAFGDAIRALYSVSYGVHFALKKAAGDAPRVMALEALWWAEGPNAQAIMERLAGGETDMKDSDRDAWRWRAMIMQLPPIDAAMIEQAIIEAEAKKDNSSLSALHFKRWAEGPSAQIMHIGPYSAEPASIVALHKAIAEHGSKPRGRHHEIYLGDPRTSAPEKLRTILRQSIEPA